MWQKQSCPIEDDLHGLFFLNSSCGWAFTYGSGTILGTLDGGQTWSVQAQLNPIYFEYIQFVDENNGWLCGEYGFVYKTADGGKNWTDASPAVPNRIIHPFGDDEAPDGNLYLFYAMHFFDAKTGFVSGTSMNPSKGWESCENVLFQTNDAGVTWMRHPSPPKDSLFRFVFMDDHKGYALGGRTIHKTLDRGKTWQTVYAEAEPREQFRGLYFLNEEMGWACGFRGRVLRTQDGGTTWQSITVTQNRLRDIVFLDETSGFLVGDTHADEFSLFKTEDAGMTWKGVGIKAPDLHRVIRAEKCLWLAGKNGSIFMYRKAP